MPSVNHQPAITAMPHSQEGNLHRNIEGSRTARRSSGLSVGGINKVSGSDSFLLVVSLLLSGLLTAIALRSPEFGWTAWFSLFPLFLAIQILTPLWAGAAGAVWGLALYVFSVMVIGGGILPSIKSITLVTIIPTIYAFGAARLSHCLSIRPLILALGWIGVELCLTPLGLSEGLLASSQGDSYQHYWISRSLGYVFVAFLIAGANVLLLNILCEVRFRLPRQALSIPQPQSTIFHNISTVSLCRQLAFCRIRSRAPPDPRVFSCQT